MSTTGFLGHPSLLVGGEELIYLIGALGRRNSVCWSSSPSLGSACLKTVCFLLCRREIKVSDLMS